MGIDPTWSDSGKMGGLNKNWNVCVCVCVGSDVQSMEY